MRSSVETIEAELDTHIDAFATPIYGCNWSYERQSGNATVNPDDETDTGVAQYPEESSVRQHIIKPDDATYWSNMTGKPYLGTNAPPQRTHATGGTTDE